MYGLYTQIYDIFVSNWQKEKINENQNEIIVLSLLNSIQFEKD